MVQVGQLFVYLLACLLPDIYLLTWNYQRAWRPVSLNEHLHRSKLQSHPFPLSEPTPHFFVSSWGRASMEPTTDCQLRTPSHSRCANVSRHLRDPHSTPPPLLIVTTIIRRCQAPDVFINFFHPPLFHVTEQRATVSPGKADLSSLDSPWSLGPSIFGRPST